MYEQEYPEEDQKYIDERLDSTDVRATTAARHLVPFAKSLRKPQKPTKYVWGEDARERLDLKCYNRQIEREGTLSPRQTEVVQDLANGFLLRSIAEKDHVSYGAIVWHLREARTRLDALSNFHLIKLAVKKGLIH